ncbi:hypothetical protein [Georgenia alba]|uniref:Uncharacterized protein n=1 Tax=Georgenia alba TaxID=2233858 RepID=A0ABW2Q9M4_9MICO
MRRHGRRRRPATALLTAAMVAGTGVPALGAPAAAHPGHGTPGGPHGHDLPAHIDGGAWDAGHVQGIAVDRRRGYVYYSFTTMLVKTDLAGNVVGTVTGLTGHLGDLDLNPRDGRVYGSLEYKDAEAFYIAVIDVDEVDEIGMDAETSGVLTTVHLQEVVDDFTADMDGDGVFDGDVADTADHRYGCSGIDGVSFGPAFGHRHGRQHGRQLLSVAYGVYSNTERSDNDHQVILQYDVSRWRHLERPLSEAEPHRSGPREPAGKYFVRTGNTRYGVQNLEYDPYTGNWLLGVYRGEKPQFPNHSLYIVDGAAPPVRGPVVGQPEPEEGMLLSLVEDGRLHEPSGVRGWEFTADVGIESFGDGTYYVARQSDVVVDGRSLEAADLYLHRWTGEVPTPFEQVGGTR